MNRISKKYLGVGLIVIIFSSVSCSSSKINNRSPNLEDGGVVSASIEAGQKLSIMISKPDGLVSYEGPQGKISVGCKIGKNPNVMYEPASGIYSLILDEDGDGFPESAVNRNTGARVKFSIETKE